MSELDIPITGMTCAVCAHDLEAALKRVPGVESVSVDLAGERASVRGTVDLAAVKEAVANAGYGVGTRAPKDGAR